MNAVVVESPDEDGSGISEFDRKLIDLAEKHYFDPYGWALTVYPWGEKGTFLADWPDGPDEWQTRVLKDIGHHMQKVAAGLVDENATFVAVRSGNGVGKSALIAIVIQWFMSTRPLTAGVVTAGTERQLSTKTWRELFKWHNLLLNKDWFEWNARSYRLKSKGTLWSCEAIPWSETSYTSFQGTHEGHVLEIMDEASGIADLIWEAVDGAFTTRGGLRIVFGNPNEPSGRFAECFARFKHRWLTYTVDARTAKAADKQNIKQWLEDYGEDSDFFRVRVRGLPPRQAANRLITADMWEKAVNRTDIEEEWVPSSLPLVCGIDVGMGGLSKTALVFRRGPLVRPQDIIKFSDANVMTSAERIATQLSARRPDAVFIDANVVGKGVYDRLIQLGYSNVIPVYGGDRSVVYDKLVYYNPRAEWWGRMARWLNESRIPADRDLRDELLAQPIDYATGNLLKLMAKFQMLELGLPSPDIADALSMTFAQTVAPAVAPGFTTQSYVPDYV